MEPRLVRWCRRSIRAAALLVLADRRDDWRREWDAELHRYSANLERREAHGAHDRSELIRRSAGAWRHAASLRREAWSIDMMQDLRYAVRTLAGRPSYTIAALATLALAIGATTAIFSVVYGVLLRPLPYHEPDRLVQLWETNPSRNWTEATIAPANLLDWRQRNRVFDDIAFYIGSDSRAASLTDYVFTESGDAERLQGLRVSTNFFDVLGVAPMIGRTFRPEESTLGQHAVVVLSERFWRQRLGADPDVAGREISLSGTTYLVVGVMPDRFRFDWARPDFWAPLAYSPAQLGQMRVPHWLRAVARLKPGVTVERAREDMTRIAAELEREYPASNAQMDVGLGSLDDWFVGNVRTVLLVFLGAVAFVLLIGCANVASLMLARAADRGREMAVRTALGASRLRLVRQLLAESVVLGGAGAAIGTAIAWSTLGLLVAAIPPDVPRLDEVRIDLTVLAFVAAVSVATVVFFGLAPALQAARVDAAPALKDGSRGTAAAGLRFRRAIVVVEVALAVALVAGAGVLLRSFDRLQRVDTGIDPRGVLTASLALPRLDYDTPEKTVAFWEELVQGLRALPGVTAAGGSTRIALQGYDWTGDLSIEGRPGVWGRELRHKQVVPGYFEAIGLPLLGGRSFLPTDDASAPPVVVVNAALAREFFPGEDPVGQRISFQRPDAAAHTWRTVIGMVADEKQDGLAAAVKPEVYVSHRQQPQYAMNIVLRAAVPPASLVSDVRRIVRAVDPAVPLYRVQTLEQIVAESTARERFTVLLLGSVAALALVLAAVGVYGVVAYTVSSKTMEIGLRIALGARPGDIVRMVQAEGLRMVAVGLALGLGLALLTSGALASLLFETAPADPWTFAAVALFLVLVTLIATMLPARRASRVEPVTALRAQ
jgi:putative ABC transport system permease protein